MLLIELGYSSEIDWAESIKKCSTREQFFSEYVWVVLNSGMKNQVAEKVWQRIKEAWEKGLPTSSAFKHTGKVAAIDYVAANLDLLWRNWTKANRLGTDHALDFLESLPWIGPITKYHLAKNYGVDVAKPDRHLQRVAAWTNETPQGLCERIARETGDRVATVDLVIWRACNLGIVNSKGPRLCVQEAGPVN